MSTTRTILICSGKGGVGKTTTTANLGIALARQGAKTVVLDADFGLRNLDLLLGLENRIVYTAQEVLAETCRLEQALVKHKQEPNLALLPAGNPRMLEWLKPKDMQAIVALLERQFDYVLIDCPAGIEDGFKNAVAAAKEAIVITTPERAKDLKQKPVYVLGTGECITHNMISMMPNLTVSGAATSGPIAYERAGVKASDIDVLALYDAFTINVILFLEDLGFCKKGEGGALVEGGGIAPGGKLAVNTSGGGLSYCHPGMYGLLVLIEAARQIQGVCGARQQDDVNLTLAHGNGGVLSSQCTVILGSEATL